MRSLNDRRLGGHTDTASTVPQLSTKQKIALVRWTHTRNGWTSEVVQAAYLDHTVDAWIVLIDGNQHTLSRDDWNLCTQ